MQQETAMTSFTKRLYSTRYFDWVFGISALLCIFAIALSADADLPVAQDAERPILFGLAMCATAIAASLLFCLTSRLDHRFADDYLFQLLSQSAMIALFAVILVTIIRDMVLLPIFGAPQTSLTMITVLPVIGVAWPIGYFFLRWRGTGE